MTHPSPEKISTVLGFLTPHSKSAFIAEKSKDQNMSWLRGLAAQGAFLVPQDIFFRSPGASNARFTDTAILGFPNVVALAGVIDGADFEVLAQPHSVTKMMDNGLDPEGYLLLNDTAYGLAEKMGKKEAEHAMRTYLSGKRARTALADMDLDAGASLPVQIRPI